MANLGFGSEELLQLLIMMFFWPSLVGVLPKDWLCMIGIQQAWSVVNPTPLRHSDSATCHPGSNSVPRCSGKLRSKSYFTVCVFLCVGEGGGERLRG